MEQVGMRESAYCGRSGGRAAARGPGAPPKGGTQALPAADFRPRLAVVLAAPKRCSPGALLPWEPAALGSCLQRPQKPGPWFREPQERRGSEQGLKALGARIRGAPPQGCGGQTQLS